MIENKLHKGASGGKSERKSTASIAGRIFEKVEASVKAICDMHAGVRRKMLLIPNLKGEGVLDLPRSGEHALVDRFSGVLSALYWEPERGVFVLNNAGDTEPCALGVVFELNALISADYTLMQGIERLLGAAYPAQTVIAATLFASSSVRGTLAEYVQSRRASCGVEGGSSLRSEECAGVCLRMAIERARKLEAMARASCAGIHPVREYRVWITITTRVGEAAVADFLAGAKNAQVDAFLLSTAAAHSALQQFSLLKSRWDEYELFRTMRELVNPQKTAAGEYIPRTAPSTLLREGFVRRDTLIDVGKSSIVFSSAFGADASKAGAKTSQEALESASLTVAGYPAFAQLNRMRMALAGDKFPYPYVLTCVVEPTSVADDKALIAMKNARVKQLMHTEIGQFLTDLGERARDFDLAQKACDEGSGLARVIHAMTVFAPKNEAPSAAHLAADLLSGAGFDAHPAAGLQMMAFLMNLPLEASIGLMQDARAARQTSTKTRKAAAHMLPIMAESRGSGPRAAANARTPMLMLVTRKGQLLPIDIFANRSGNYNAVIAGTSGSGKSVLAQEIVLSHIGLGGRVWVFDIGKSYKNCVELAHGQFIDFEREESSQAKAQAAQRSNSSGLCLNPLDMLEDPADMLDELAQIITAMANGDAPMELTALELLKMHIAEVVKTARSQKKTPTVTMLALSLMQSKDAMLADIAVRLMPYCAGGRYAHWFEGKASIDFASNLVVLEMEALANKPVLQNVVLLIVIMRILREIRESPRSQKKLIVIDEAWRLLSGNSGRFIEWACRTLRKYGAGIACISQSMSDFEASSAARAVRMNADSVFLLRQKPEGIASYAAGDARTAKLLSGLTTHAGLWSEVYVKVGDQAGVVGRLMLDRFSMTSYSTKAEVFDAVQKARKAGLTIEKAIAEVSRMELES